MSAARVGAPEGPGDRGGDDRVRDAFLRACRAELEALKPGNVHLYASGHGMVVRDFELSAEAAAGPLACRGRGLGVRILRAVEATRAAVGQNTNLGILLLCAPLAEAAIAHGALPLDHGVRRVLHELGPEDAELAFRAIALAAPGGLGRVARNDVHEPATAGLLAAMADAAERDRIAWNYVHDLADVLGRGKACAAGLGGRGWPLVWLVTALFLDFLRSLPDSHIVRKLGAAAATETMRAAEIHNSRLLAGDDPASCAPDLLAFDSLLKRQGRNPGTSADLTVATLMALFLEGDGIPIAAG